MQEQLHVQILLGILPNLLLLALNLLRPLYASFMSKRLPRFQRYDSFIPLIVLWALINGGISYYVVVYTQSFPLLLSVFFISTLVNLFFLWKELHKLRDLGIHSADRTVEKGIDYEKSLKLCRNQLRFLGTGAAKLTSTEEFELALLRCNYKPIQLLLLKPTDDILADAAKQAGEEKDEYQRRVRISLRKIRDLKTKRSLNIKVHFYKEPQIFRLMFIDDSICLFSYNVYGEKEEGGEGRKLPQLHILRPPHPYRAFKSFYYPLEQYFDTLWKASEQDTWDFKSYLD